jgi:streptomycin 6-kinase
MSESPDLREYVEPDPVRITERLMACARRWKLQMGDALAGGFRSHVFAAVRPDGMEVVVKLVDVPAEAEAEVAALRVWAASGAAVVLIGFDRDNQALLLEHIRPGSPLPPADETAAVGVAAELLPRLHAVQIDFGFPTLDQVYLAFEARARAGCSYFRQSRAEPEGGEAGLSRLGAARRLALKLADSASHPVLLHGDFVDKNLLWDGSRHLAIDPIPAIGDPCSDIGFFRPATRRFPGSSPGPTRLPAGWVMTHSGRSVGLSSGPSFRQPRGGDRTRLSWRS